MSKIKLLLVALFITAGALTSQAQKTKVGVINIGDILQLMPEYDSIQVAYNAKYQSIQSDLQTMYQEYEAKQAELAKNQAQLTEMMKGIKMQELEDLQKRIQTLQQGAQGELESFEQTRVKPLLDKIKKAIKEVAKENGYTHIINNTQDQVLYFDEAFDILPLVKKKLNLKDKPIPKIGQ